MEKKNPRININFAYDSFRISQKLIKEIFTHILKKEKTSLNFIIDIAFTGNAEIKKLNKQYRGKDKPTDVLSFSMMDDDEIGFARASSRSPLLGEIIISVPYAKEQAKEKKHSLKNEILFLLVHGLLHLLGHDDETVKGYDEMIKKQNEYMAHVVRRTLAPSHPRAW